MDTRSEHPPISGDSFGVSMVRSILRAYRRSNLKGQTLLTLLLAKRMKSLQEISIQIADWPPIYMNMQYLNAHPWFLDTPFEHSPYEVNEQAVMQRFVKPGDVAFDVGANVGMHTMLLSQLVGAEGLVVSFEPNVDLLPMLRRTVAAVSNIKLYPCALSDQNEESTLFVPDDHSMASLADWTKDRQPKLMTRLLGFGQTHTIPCQQRRMDELVSIEGIPRPNFIKCDVEGAELMVFKGGRDTLNRHDAPIILFEAGAESAQGFNLKITEAADFLSRLSQPGYQFLEMLEGGGLRAVLPADFKPQNQNILAVPKSKEELCPELSMR